MREGPDPLFYVCIISLASALVSAPRAILTPSAPPPPPSQNSDAVSLVTHLGPTVLKTVGGLGLLLVGGRLVLRRIFEVRGRGRVRGGGRGRGGRQGGATVALSPICRSMCCISVPYDCLPPLLFPLLPCPPPPPFRWWLRAAIQRPSSHCACSPSPAHPTPPAGLNERGLCDLCE